MAIGAARQEANKRRLSMVFPLGVRSSITASFLD
jgi:hypothetical protein